MSKDNNDKGTDLVSIFERLGYQKSDANRILELRKPENKNLAIQEQYKIWDAVKKNDVPVFETDLLCKELFKDNYIDSLTLFNMKQDSRLKPPPSLNTPTQEDLDKASKQMKEQQQGHVNLGPLQQNNQPEPKKTPLVPPPGFGEDNKKLHDELFPKKTTEPKPNPDSPQRLGIEHEYFSMGKSLPNGNELEEEEKKKKKDGIPFTFDTPEPLNEKDLEGKKHTFKFDGKEHSSSITKDPGKDNQYLVKMDPPLEPGKEAEGMRKWFREAMGMEPPPELTTLKTGEKGYDLTPEQSKIFMEKMGITAPEKEQDKTKEQDKSKEQEKSKEKGKEEKSKEQDNKDKNKGPNFPSHNQGGNKGSGFSSFGDWGKVEETNGVQKQSLPNVNQPGKDGHQK